MKKAKLLFGLIAVCSINLTNAQTIKETVNYISSQTNQRVRVDEKDLLNTTVYMDRIYFDLSKVEMSVETYLPNIDKSYQKESDPFIVVRCVKNDGGYLYKCVYSWSKENNMWLGYDYGTIDIYDQTSYTGKKIINALKHLGILLEKRKEDELKSRQQKSHFNNANDPFAPQNYKNK